MNKIILSDGSCLQDLICLQKRANSEEIEKCIERVKKLKPYEYTSADILAAIEQEFGIENIIDISSIGEFYY